MVEHDPDLITGYHAHIYYDEATRETAARIREALDQRFDVELGRRRYQPVGPHPRSMYQVAFPVREFGRIIPWLALNRDGLVILVHPLTGDDYGDHAYYALWLGEKLELKLDVLKKSELSWPPGRFRRSDKRSSRSLRDRNRTRRGEGSRPELRGFLQAAVRGG